MMNHQTSIAQTKTTCEQKRCPKRLYHVTLPDNCISISKRGIDPAFSQSHRERVYFVEYRCLRWAIPFIAKRHDCGVENLVIFRVRGGARCKPLGAGKWYAPHAKKAHYYDDAVYHVK
jgi:hypothetical protein